MPDLPERERTGRARPEQTLKPEFPAKARGDSSATIRELARDAALWGTPIVSVYAMREAFLRDAGAKYGDLVYVSRFADWKFQITTPNASTRYVFAFFNLKHGPVVIDIPVADGAGLFGSILDAWQVPLEDVGPHGADQGRGGRYLLLPPGYEDAVDGGYIAVPSETFNLYAAFRAISEGSSQPAVERALDLINQIKVYPLSDANNGHETRAIDVAGKLFDGIMHYDDTFYESLAKMVDEEPAMPRDAGILRKLKGLGIEKGKPFAPPADVRAELKAAANETRSKLIASLPTYGEKFWPSTSWMIGDPAGPETSFTFTKNGKLDVEARAVTYFLACAPPKNLGKASMYLAAYVDSSGAPLLGKGSYHLHLPANPPAEEFWALTVYDTETCAFIRGSPKVEVNSYHEDLQTNSDGSVDLYLSATAPNGKEGNWIALAVGQPWFAFLRFYGPKEALFDKSWTAPNIEKID
jgi:hypothetical protein